MDHLSDEGVDLLSIGFIGLQDLLNSQAAMSQITANKESLKVFGQGHEDWIHFLNTLQSFGEWLAVQVEERSDKDNGLFLTVQQQQLTRSRALTLLQLDTHPWRRHSCHFGPILVIIFELISIFIYFRDLKKGPALWVYIQGWERDYAGAHATAFTKKQFQQFHSMEETPKNLFLKDYALLMTAFAERSAEIVNMDWNQLKRCTESEPMDTDFSS